MCLPLLSPSTLETSHKDDLVIMSTSKPKATEVKDEGTTTFKNEIFKVTTCCKGFKILITEMALFKSVKLYRTHEVSVIIISK